VLVNAISTLALMLSAVVLCGGEDLTVRDRSSLLVPSLQHSEVAGFGTTFAAAPDLIAMLKRQSRRGMNPRMAAIMGIFQIVWVYYGILIASQPVNVWNVVATVVNLLSVAAYLHFARSERN
jgi:MtN3 and saliva related transmembrane protein